MIRNHSSLFRIWHERWLLLCFVRQRAPLITTFLVFVVAALNCVRNLIFLSLIFFRRKSFKLFVRKVFHLSISHQLAQQINTATCSHKSNSKVLALHFLLCCAAKTKTNKFWIASNYAALWFKFFALLSNIANSKLNFILFHVRSQSIKRGQHHKTSTMMMVQIKLFLFVDLDLMH